MIHSSIRFLFLFLLGTTLCSNAQEQDAFQRSANMMPPSPTASELGKYGLIPVGLATGSSRVDIPLYNFTTKNISVPISLSYSSNGIKVDQTATWVGLGWSLNAGGVITRLVRDEADDPNPEPLPDNFSMANEEAGSYMLKADPANYFDSEQDLYSFNFMGKTGKFMYSRSGELLVMPHQNISIKRVFGGSAGDFFKITTGDGVIYTFGAIEKSKTIVEGTGCGKAFNGNQVTAWYLTQIEHPAGGIVDLTYEDYFYQYPLSVSQTVSRVLGQSVTNCNSGSGGCYSNYTQACATHMLVEGKSLRSISSTGFGRVDFGATRDRSDLDDYKLNTLIIKDPADDVVKSFSFDYVFSDNQNFSNEWTTLGVDHRMFLTAVRELDENGVLVKSHVLNYNDMNGLPPRLSYAQDHWGYYNGANNGNYLVPKNDMVWGNSKPFEGTGGNREASAAHAAKGLLKSVTWPTGGETEIQYEPNVYRGTQLVSPPLVDVFLSGSGVGHHGTSTITDNIPTITYRQTLEFEAKAFWEGEEVDFDPIHHKGQFRIINITTQQEEFITNIVAGQSAVKTYLEVQAGNEYQLEITVSGAQVYCTFSTKYVPQLPQTVETNIPTGGLRVAHTLDKDPLTGTILTTNYNYASVVQPDISSGAAQVHPAYYVTNREWADVTCSSDNGTYTVKIQCLNGVMHSSSLSSLYPFEGSNVYYRYVTVSRGSGTPIGATEHQFIVSYDVPATQVWGTDEILYTPRSNFGWDNGLELATRTYKRQGETLILLREILNEYKTDSSRLAQVRNVVVRRNLDPLSTQVSHTFCTAEETTLRRTNFICIAQHEHVWEIDPLRTETRIRCTLSDANNVLNVTWQHPCYGKNAGDPWERPVPPTNLDAMEYKSVAFWFYLFRTTEKYYDMNGQNPVTSVTEYFYDNPIHAQLTRQRSRSSNGKTEEVSMSYIDDYEDVSNFHVLRDKFIVNLPVKTLNTVDESLVKGQIITYSDNGSPIELFEYESNSILPAPQHDPNTVVPPLDFKLNTTLAYDLNSNLTDVNPRSGVKVAYKWGYDNTRIVSRVIGATSDQIFVESFETTGQVGDAKTGVRCSTSGTFVISTLEFNPVSTDGLVMSYWYWEDNEWKFSGELNFSRTISRGSKLDEVRVYPRGAQVTTFYYDEHRNVVKSVTDTNNITTTYEHDAAGRLEVVRDHDNNIRTKYQYYYYNN